MPTPYRIELVCLGNICRSPMAEVVLRSMLADAGLGHRVEVASAGTGPWHVGSGANPAAVRALARRGYDGGGHVARQISAADIAAADLVVGLDHSNVADLRALAGPGATLALLRDFDPGAAGTSLDVPDPYGGPDEEFDDALELITRACRGLVAALPVSS